VTDHDDATVEPVAKQSAGSLFGAPAGRAPSVGRAPRPIDGLDNGDTATATPAGPTPVRHRSDRPHLEQGFAALRDQLCRRNPPVMSVTPCGLPT
jgi:hypothetical protein